MFSQFPTIDYSFWKQIYKIPFNTTRETKIQALQYKIIHNTIACNQWLNRIKIKESETCSYCNILDNIPHFSINFEQTKAFWKTWGLWWKRLTNFNIRQQDDIIERTLFGFPGNTDKIIKINYCIIYAKHYIYQNKINNDNNIDFLSYLSLLKRHLLIEREICIAQSQEHKFSNLIMC